MLIKYVCEHNLTMNSKNMHEYIHHTLLWTLWWRQLFFGVCEPVWWELYCRTTVCLLNFWLIHIRFCSHYIIPIFVHLKFYLHNINTFLSLSWIFPNCFQMDSVMEWEMQFTEKYDQVGKLLKPGEKHCNYKAEESGDESKSENTKKVNWWLFDFGCARFIGGWNEDENEKLFFLGIRLFRIERDNFIGLDFTIEIGLIGAN